MRSYFDTFETDAYPRHRMGVCSYTRDDPIGLRPDPIRWAAGCQALNAPVRIGPYDCFKKTETFSAPASASGLNLRKARTAASTTAEIARSASLSLSVTFEKD
jgi:hypothetical protein